MAVKVLVQYRPGYPQTASAVQDPMWMDITERIDFASLQWEQQATDKNTSLRFDVFTFLPISTTRYDEYPSWTSESAPIDPADPDPRLGDAVHDVAFFIELTNRAEIKVLDGADVLFGGVIGVVDTQRQGSSHVVQQVEAYDYTALLDEIVVRDYNAPNVSETLGELATTSGLTSQVVTGGSTLTAGPYTFRVIAVDASGNPLVIFTHITQYISSTDVTPANISDTPLRTIQLNWDEVTDPALDEYLIYGKQGIGTNNMYYQATVAAGTETYSISTAPVTNTAASPEQYVQKGSIDVDIIIGSNDPANNNYNGIFNAIDPELDPGINHSTYVKPAKILTNGDPDPDKSYRFSPTLETGIVLTSPFGGKTLKQALKTISDKTGAIFWVDADKNLHYANKKAQELVQNPRFDSNTQYWTLGVNHTIGASRGPFGYGNALVASSSSSTNETKSDPIEVTANTIYMARARGWADSNFASDWDCELRFYSDTAGLVQVGNAHKLHRNVAYDSADEQRWCKTWVIAEAHNTAVRARLVAKRKNGASGACAWTDFSLIEITGTYGFSDNPSDSAYDLPMKSFETPRAPREASGVANRLLVYGVYKDPANTAELESVVYDAGLTLTKAQGGSLDANTYWVRVVAETPDGDVYVKYATETITDADVAAATPVRTLSANWSSVPTATQYRVYIGSGRMQMRLKATQAGTSLSITTMPAGGAALSGEPDVYYYKTFDFAPGLWESGGKVVEATLNDQLVDSEEKAQTRALSFWEEKGIAMRTWEFDHLEEPPMVGSVIPFIWEADDIAEPLVVKGNKGKFLGDRIFWTTTVGSDPSLIKKGVTQIFADLKQATLRLNDTQAPARPLNLALTAPSGSLIQTVDGVSRATVVAEWEPSAEDDFAHYVVQYGYDANFANAQVINVAQTPNIRSSATGINAKVVHSFQAEPGKRLYFRAAAQDKTGNRSDFTDSAIDLPADTTPPDAPTNVQITASLKSIAITWGFGFYDPALPDQNTNNTDFSRFRVYRKQYNAATNPNEPWTKIAETSTNVYIDTNFANYTSLFQYKVSTVDRTGNESTATQEATPTFRSPNKITGSVDIEDATITSAQIASLTANLITAGTLNISTGMSVISDGTAALPQFEVDKDGVTIRDDSGNIVLQVNGATSTLNADYIDVTNLAASEVTVGSGNSVVRVGNYPSSVSPTFQGIWGGNANPSSAAFTLSTSGAVTASNISATGGSVGGWTIGSTSLSGGDTTIASSGDITVGSGSNIARISSSDPAYRLWLGGTTASTAPFRVTSTGSFTATSADITGTVSTNNITATGGTVGGWTLSSTSLTAGTGGNTVGIATSGGYAFYAGDSNPSLAEFSVTPAGALNATNATISGSITATSGAIGGWTIGSTSLSGGNTTISSTGDITVGSGSNIARLSSSDPAYRLWLGGTTASTAPFRVTSTGSFTATDANITGTVSTNNITATGGTVGGWTLSSTSLTAGTGGNTVGIATSGGYAFYAGDSTPSLAEFSVTPAGALTATNATVSGSITATSGAIGGWTIGAATISSSSGNVVLSNSGIITAGATSPNQAHMSGNGFWAGAGAADHATAPFRVSTSGGVTAKNISVIGGTVSVGDAPVAISYLSRNASGVVTIKTSGAVNATVGQNITIDVTSSPYTTDADFNGSFNVLSITTSAPYTLTYQGATASAISEVSATGFVYTGARISGESASGTWFSIDSGFALKNPANVAQNIITATASDVTINADFIKAGTVTLGNLGSNAISSTNFSVSNTGTVTAAAGTIGGWTLSSTALTSGTGASTVGLATSGGYAIYAGNATAGSAPFSVTPAGALSASSGTVGGWTLGPTSLTGGNTTISNTGDITVGTGSNIARLSSSDAAYRLWLGGTTASTAPFRVTSTGSFTATDANITGTVTATSGSFTGTVVTSNITATGGTVGGWTLGQYNLISGSGASTVGLATSGGYAIYAGNATAGSAPFSVTPAGVLKAESGTVGGWTLSSTALTSGTGASAVGVATSGGYAFYAGDTDPSLAEFRVTPAGALTATNATITGAITATSGSFTGDVTTNNISATAGTVGGWTLTSSGSTRLYAGTTNSFTGLVASSTSSAVAIFAGATSNSGTSASFTVTNAGALSASNATISGSITATAGSIGGWSVDGSRIYNALAISPYIAGLQGSSTSTGIAFFAGATSSTGATSAFSVNNSGAVTASNITATGGTIGGWTLASTPSRLHAGSGSAFVGLSADTTSLATTIFAGATDNTGTGAKFKVLNDGSITATSGTIGGWDLASDRITGVGTTKYAGLINTSTDAGLAFFAGASDTSGTSATFTVTNAGALTATSGLIGGWTVASDKIYNSGVTKFIGLIDAPADTDVALFAGATTSTGTGAFFSVTNAGVVTASNATISGAITATSGSIGGWSVDGSRIYNALAISPYVAGLQGSSTSTGVAFFAGATTSTGTSAAFTVTNDGAVTASNMTVTGGGVGGWKIDTDKIYNALAVSPYISGLYRTSTSTGLAFFAGATTSTGTSAAFSVNNLGAVSASNVSITGGPSGGNVINISSGQFSVDSAGYMNAKTGKFSPGSGTASSGQPALLLAGGSLTGDIAYASGQSLNFGVTTATQGVNGAFTEYMRLDASGNLRLYSGYFAIGSTDVFKVDTSGNITITGNIVDAGDTVMQITGGDLIIQHGTAGTTPRLLFRRGDGTYNAGINSDLAGDINFYSGSSTSSYADLYMDQLLPGNAIPMSAISGMTTVSDAISSGARWHQPAAGARWELKRSSSSQRYKNTIQYPDAEFLSIARNIRPRFFKRNDETAGRRHLGFIAEEVHAAGLLEAVTYWDDGAGIMIDGIEPTAILATALLRIKDLEDRLEALENA